LVFLSSRKDIRVACRHNLSAVIVVKVKEKKKIRVVFAAELVYGKRKVPPYLKDLPLLFQNNPPNLFGYVLVLA